MPPQEAEDAGVGGDSVGDGGGSWYRGGNNGAEEAGTSGRDDGDADDLQVASPAGRAASRPGALRRPSAEFGARGRVRRTSIDSILKVGGAAEYGDSPRVRPGRRVSVNPAGMEGGDVTDSPRLRPAGRRVSMHVPESEQMAFDGRMAESSGVLVENSGGSAPHGSPRVRPGDDRVATQTLMLVPGQAMSGHESLPHTPNGWAPMRDFVLKAGLGSQDMSSAQGMSKNGSVELPGGIMTRIDSMVSGMGSDAGTGKRHSIYDAAPKSAKEDGGTGKKKLKIVMSSLIKVDDQPRQWWQPRVILPTERWYNIFWYMCMTLALLNAVLDPYKLAFEDPSGFNPYNDFFTIIEYISILVFAIDIVLKFFVAYEDEEQRTFVTDLGEIRVAFLRMMFWLDLLFWFPFASVINQALGPNAPYSTQMYVMLLSWLKCGRLYRVFIMFAHLDHSMIISQISLMLVRNFFYILATCHWFACIIYFIGKAEVVGGMDSWLSRPVAAARFEGFPPIVAYVNTIYLSINLFAGLGDADFYVATWIEALVTSAYLLFNVVLGAYILGTVTMLMVKGDERIKAYRDRVVTLKEYVSMNDLPGQLHSAMKQHLELHFHSEQTSDERVLKDYPRPIRRRVLRHLYLQSIYQCYVMRGCKPKFLDALLSACSTDLFMPDVQLIADGDVVSELLVIIEGEVDVVRVARESSVAGSNATTLGGKLGSTLSSGDGEDHSRRMSMASLTGSMNAGSMGQRSLGGGQSAGRERRGESQPVGEIAFFTERPSSEAVWTCSVVRMLVLSKAAFDSLSATYASQVRTVLTNMRDQTERLAIHELNEALDELPHVEGSLHEQLKEYITHGVGLVTADLPEPQLSELKSLLDSKQQHRISDLDAMNEAFDRLCEKQDKQRLFDMFSAASAGENDLLLQMLKQGVDVNAVDEAGRTVLMVAAHAGRADIVELLLALEASPELSDGDGHSALSLALLNGHADVARMLKDAGASLAHSNHVILPAIIACIVGGNTTLLTHLLQAGADVGMVDFAHRSLLHIAAIAGDAAAAAALLDAGAPVLLTDSWGSTPLETAEARQHEAVAALLRPAVAAARARGYDLSPSHSVASARKLTLLQKAKSGGGPGGPGSPSAGGGALQRRKSVRQSTARSAARLSFTQGRLSLSQARPGSAAGHNADNEDGSAKRASDEAEALVAPPLAGGPRIGLRVWPSLDEGHPAMRHGLTRQLFHSAHSGEDLPSAKTSEDGRSNAYSEADEDGPGDAPRGGQEAAAAVGSAQQSGRRGLRSPPPPLPLPPEPEIGPGEEAAEADLLEGEMAVAALAAAAQKEADAAMAAAAAASLVEAPSGLRSQASNPASLQRRFSPVPSALASPGRRVSPLPNPTASPQERVSPAPIPAASPEGRASPVPNVTASQGRRVSPSPSTTPRQRSPAPDELPDDLMQRPVRRSPAPDVAPPPPHDGGSPLPPGTHAPGLSGAPSGTGAAAAPVRSASPMSAMLAELLGTDGSPPSAAPRQAASPLGRAAPRAADGAAAAGINWRASPLYGQSPDLEQDEDDDDGGDLPFFA